MGTPLGDFIRAKRDATSPADLGLPDDGRRRAPGLRRMELATRAGMSVEYLTRIEQGRDRNPTLPVLRAIADGLSLNVAERRHLTFLAKIAGGACVGQRQLNPAPLRQEVRSASLETLRLLEPDGVAMITNKLGDVLARSSAFERVMRPTGLLDAEEPNLLRYLFTDPRAHQALLNWEYVADVQSFDLWHAPTLTAAEWLKADIAAQAGSEFTARLSRNLPPESRPWQIRLPNGIITHWQREVLETPAEPEQQIVILIPADEQTRKTFEQDRWDQVTPLRAV